MHLEWLAVWPCCIPWAQMGWRGWLKGWVPAPHTEPHIMSPSQGTHLLELAGAESNTAPQSGWDLPPLALSVAGGTKLCR